MSFGVSVTTRTARASGGAQSRTGTLFLCGPAASVASGQVTLSSIDDFEAAVGIRAGVTIPSWDAVEFFFGAGGSKVVYAPFAVDFGDALALIDDQKYGPGQLAVVGVVPGATLYQDMQTLSMTTNRVALRDVTQNGSPTQMKADGLLAPTSDEYGASFAPWLTIPPPPGVIGAAPREIPASIVIAALCSDVDSDGNPNRAAAGDDYPVQYATGMTVEVNQVDRAGLFQSGVNAFDDEFILENWGFQTNLAEDPAQPYWQFNCSRARMALVDASRQRARPFMFRPLDGRGKLEGQLQSAVEDECAVMYGNDVMYGATPEEAYSVNVSSSVNTSSTIAQGELKAVASVVWTMHAKAVDIELVTVPLGSPVA